MERPITQEDFYGHCFNDSCPHREGSVVTAYKSKLGNALRRRFLGREPLERVGLKTIQEFILAGGTQSDCLSVFYAPSVFESGKYNPGTIVRLNHEYYERRVCESFGGGYINRETSYSQESLGIVLSPPGNNKPKKLLVLRGSEAEIMMGHHARLWVEGAIPLGEWIHHPWRTGFIFPGRWETDYFYNFEQIEILAIGKSLKEKAPQKALSPSLKKVAVQVTR